MSLSISMCGIKLNYQVKHLIYPSQPSTKKSTFGWATYKKCLDNANSVAVHQVSINLFYLLFAAVINLCNIFETLRKSEMHYRHKLQRSKHFLQYKDNHLIEEENME